MSPNPLYDGLNLDPAFHLRYSWTGWPSGRRFNNLSSPDLIGMIQEEREQDGMRLLEHNWSDAKIQLTFSTTPHVSPALFASRAKGRLQHTLRVAGIPQQFSRKVSVRSVGDNTTEEVIAYIESQVGKERFVDAKFATMLNEFTLTNSSVDLSQPSASAHGRYWYNLHLVLVVRDNGHLVDRERLAKIRDGAFRIADMKGYAIGAASVMPNHIHLALRGDYQRSPHEIALAFQNNLAYLLGQQRVWQENYYVGTFSDYDMWAIRNHRLAIQPDSLPSKLGRVCVKITVAPSPDYS